MLKKFEDIKTKSGEVHSVMLVFDERGTLHADSNCPCKWGSFHRWSQKNKKNKWVCRHILKAYAKVTKQNYQKAREVLIKQGILAEDHLVRE